MNPLGFPMEWMRAFLPPQVRGTTAPPSPPPPSTEEEDVLALRVAELEQRLNELRAGAGQPRAATPGKKSKRHENGNHGEESRTDNSPAP